MFFPKDKFFLIAGPCVIENLNMLKETASRLLEVSNKLKIPFIFKASFDKANRSSLKSYRGVGIEKGLEMLASIKSEYKVPILTDIHTPQMVSQVKDIVDVIQIPAFLARQTDFYIECGQHGLPVNIKKGQFMAPDEMSNAVEKYHQNGGVEAAVTERGTFFGYGNLVVDFRSIQIIKNQNIPYIFDATHSLQLPAARGQTSGGQRDFIPSLTKAQVAAGANGLFMETHPDVDNALCDKENQMPLSEMFELLKICREIYYFVRK